tara:strand:+ start:1647 stop:2597 length:951 start_codon:yes stop_codon:yes gene_type:complete
MSANSFTKSDDYNDASKCLAFLQEKKVEIHNGLTAEMPAVVFHGYFTPEAIKEWDREETEAELEKKAEGAWEEYKKSAPLTSRSLGGWARVIDGCYWCKGDKLVIQDPKLVEDVLDFLRGKKEEVIKARMDELMPKVSKSKGTGARRPKRDASEYEIVQTNTEEEAQGKDYEYCLPCDEGSTMLKDGKIQKGKGADGKDKKTQTWKAVKKATPFLTEGACKCGVTWDRASGSKKLAELGIKGSFVMGCAKNKVAGSDFCGYHPNGASVFETKYKAGKYKGVTHAQVLWVLNSEGGKVLADGDGEWVKAECGEAWKQ